MGVILNRKKPFNLLVSLVYLFNRGLIIGRKNRIKLFLSLEWIFNRLSHEESFKVFEANEHPVRTYSLAFIHSNLESNDTVLDLGCKFGDISMAISEKVKKVTGIDIDDNAISVAKNKNKAVNLTFENTDAFSYLSIKEYADEYTVLILSHVLEHIDAPEEFLSKISPYFKKIYVELPDFDSSYNNHYRLKMNSKPIYTDVDHINEFDRFELLSLAHKCGLKTIQSEYRFGVQKHWFEVTPPETT